MHRLIFIVFCLLLSACGEMDSQPESNNDSVSPKSRLHLSFEQNLQKIRAAASQKRSAVGGNNNFGFCPAFILWGDNGQSANNNTAPTCVDWNFKVSRPANQANPSRRNAPILLFPFVTETTDAISEGDSYIAAGTHTYGPTSGTDDRYDSLFLTSFLETGVSTAFTISGSVTSVDCGQHLPYVSKTENFSLEMKMERGNMNVVQPMDGGQFLGFLVSPYQEHCEPYSK